MSDQNQGNEQCILAHIGRPGEKMQQVRLREGARVKDLLIESGVVRKNGEILEREGKSVDSNELVRNNDIYFITRDDTNGRQHD